MSPAAETSATKLPPKQRRRWAWWVFGLFVGGVVLATVFGPLALDYYFAYSRVRDGHAKELVDSFARFPELRTAIGRSETLKLYEGLPHQRWESESLKRELAGKPVVTLAGYPFYKEPLEMNPADASRLKSICRSWWSFVPFRGYKACGGYHPDWCLAWSDGRQTYLVQLCFGCHEMKAFLDGKELHGDIRHGAYSELETMLARYRKNRPERGTPP
ncbi:MAG: hypothetical protein ABMA26_15135 [Limisphaerales bacterium]